MAAELEQLLGRRLQHARARTPNSGLGRQAWVVADDRICVRWERKHRLDPEDFAALHRYAAERDRIFGVGAAQTTWSSTPHLLSRLRIAVLSRTTWLAAALLAPRYMRVDL